MRRKIKLSQWLVMTLAALVLAVVMSSVPKAPQVWAAEIETGAGKQGGGVVQAGVQAGALSISADDVEEYNRVADLSGAVVLSAARLLGSEGTGLAAPAGTALAPAWAGVNIGLGLLVTAGCGGMIVRRKKIHNA